NNAGPNQGSIKRGRFPLFLFLAPNTKDMIRKARQNESPQIAQLMLLAMEEIIYAFLGNQNPEEALEFMHLLVRQEGNQYSFENTWIAEEDNQVVGSITVYDGAKLQQLRQPVLSLLV